MIHVGVDLHQRFCYMTALDATGRCLKSGAVPNQPEPLRDWLRSLPAPREVAVEACSFWPAFQSAIEREASAIHLVHPQRVKAIAAAKLKNDRVDSATLAHLLRCDLLPEAWRADHETRERRQRVRLRISLGQHRAALKNQVHASVPRARIEACRIACKCPMDRCACFHRGMTTSLGVTIT